MGPRINPVTHSNRGAALRGERDLRPVSAQRRSGTISRTTPRSELPDLFIGLILAMFFSISSFWTHQLEPTLENRGRKFFRLPTSNPTRSNPTACFERIRASHPSNRLTSDGSSSKQFSFSQQLRCNLVIGPKIGPLSLSINSTASSKVRRLSP